MFCTHRESRVDPDLGRESDCESGNRIPTICEVWEEINDSPDPWLGRPDFWYAQAYFILIQLAGIIINIMQVTKLTSYKILFSERHNIYSQFSKFPPSTARLLDRI